MRFFLISGAGEGCGLMLRLKAEGNDVGVWIRDDARKDVYDGLLHKVGKWDEFLTHDTIVIFDSTGGGRTADRLRSQGYHVATGSVFADQLEMDRDFALMLMEEVGIRVPPSQKFTSWGDARQYVQERDTRLAFKPSGPLGEELMSYVAYDAEDMLGMLDYFERTAHGTKIEFELQDYVKGAAISTEGWFNGRDFLYPFNHTFERKKMMNEELGPSGGCSGNVVWCTEENPIVKKGVGLLTGQLRSQEYVGPIDLNSIIDEEGQLWGLEFTPRFGYDAMPALLELFDGEIGRFFSDLAKGQTDGRIPLKLKAMSGALRVTVNPFPNENVPGPKGLPINGLYADDRPHAYFFDVRLTDEGRLVTHGANTVTFTGLGEDVWSALRGPYEIARRVRLPDKQFRTDMVHVLNEDMNSLIPYLQVPLIEEKKPAPPKFAGPALLQQEAFEAPSDTAQVVSAEPTRYHEHAAGPSTGGSSPTQNPQS